MGRVRCHHREDALVRRTGDVKALAAQLTELRRDRALLVSFRAGALATAPSATWDRAGDVLLDVDGETVASGQRVRAEQR
jgi:hypothetical protein